MLRVLFAEDDAFLASILAVQLSKNFEVVHVSNGEEVLSSIAKKRPDILILDLLMPVMDGFQVLEAISKDPAMKDVPKIVLSNLGQPEDIARAKAAGATEMLVKVHYTPDQLLAKVLEIEKGLATRA